MMPQSLQEEAKLDAMQRHWQSRRVGSSSVSFFEEVNETEDMLAPPLQSARPISQRGACVPPPQVVSCEVEAETEVWDFQLVEPVATPKPKLAQVSVKAPLKLDASSLGDLPAQYTICNLDSHQLPVIGVYVDRRVVPGFKYRVRPLPAVGKPSSMHKCLFDEKALTLKSIGRGYARRFTFEANVNQLNNNENYFWSDNRPEGYAFELELISDGDKFTIFDSFKGAQGTVEVIKLEAPQIEIISKENKSAVEKRANVKFTGKVEFFETGVAKLVPLSGVVISRKQRGNASAEIVKVINVSINRQRYYLVPGMQRVHTRVTVRGEEINDVPTKYTMTGLESYEIPVVGTYVDPRVIPGFCYKVRPNDRKDHLFDGRALQLISIGMGYAKRLTFQPDSLVSPENYLWSDNHPDGLGLEIRAVHKGMKFTVKAGDLILGEAEVFRDDYPQFEEKMEKIETTRGYAIQKYVHVDVICNIRLARTGGNSTENDEYLMRVSGVAVVRKEPKSNETYIVRVENVGLDSQLLLLFAHTQTKLTFVPK